MFAAAILAGVIAAPPALPPQPKALPRAAAVTLCPCEGCKCKDHSKCPLGCPAAGKPAADAPPSFSPPPGFAWKKVPGVGGSFNDWAWVQSGVTPPTMNPGVQFRPQPFWQPFPAGNPFPACPGGNCPVR